MRGVHVCGHEETTAPDFARTASCQEAANVHMSSASNIHVDLSLSDFADFHEAFRKAIAQPPRLNRKINELC